ncbi:hypothetical protein BJ742DRAFT_332458 [Cladochytrium replicatum]|nr:hypothetical protein BJ742DRAFT_332458 [Cladochytrium replicatum]
MLSFSDSLSTLEFTYVNSKILCWRPAWYAHIAMAYLVFLTGVLSFITRLHPRLYSLHFWMGRSYIVSMMWAMGSSLVIYTTGLPIGVCFSFIWCLLGLTVAYYAVSFHQKRYFRKFSLIKIPAPGTTSSIRRKFAIVVNRMFSFKALHGCAMFVSWINIAGRIFVTPVEPNFECYTYPAFKNVPSRHFNASSIDPMKITLVPQDDPNYSKMPWAYGEERWAALLSVVPLVIAFVFGMIYAFATAEPRKPKGKQLTPVNDDEI